MIRNTNRFLPVLLCIFATLTMFTSCDRDTFEILKEERVPPEIRGKRVRIQELMAQPNLARKLTALSTTGLAKSTNLAGIQIDTTNIRAIESDYYVSYTFKIVQDSIERQAVLKNYMLTIVNDTIDIQHLVEYDVLAPHVYDKDNIRLQRVFGDELRSQFMKCGEDSAFTSYQVCVGVPCTGDEHHSIGETCPQTGNNRAYEYCYTEWANIAAIPCNGGGGGGGSYSGGPASGGSDDDGIITVPVGPNDGEITIIDDGCEAVKAQMADANYKTRIKDVLDTPAIFSRTLETGIAEKINNAGATLYVDMIPVGQTSIRIPGGYTNTKGATHVHQEDFAFVPRTGVTEISHTSRLPSAKDLITFFGICNATQRDNPSSFSTDDIYVNTLVKRQSSSGYNTSIYSFRFNSAIPTPYNPSISTDKVYNRYVGLNSEEGFLTFVKDEMGVDSDYFKLYRADHDGNVYKLELGPDDTLITTKCN